MNSFILCCKYKLFHLTDHIEEHSTVSIIRKGLTMLLPFFIIGSYATLLLYFPNNSYQRFLHTFWNGNLYEVVYIIYVATFGFLSPMIVFTVSYQFALVKTGRSFAKYQMPIISVLCFLIFSGFGRAEFSIIYFNLSDVAIAIIISLISCNFLMIFYNLPLFKRTHGEIDSTLQQAFQTILPGAIILILFSLIQILFTKLSGISYFNNFINTLIEDFIYSPIDSAGFAFIYIFLIQLLCFFCLPYTNIFTHTVGLASVLVLGNTIYGKAVLLGLATTYISLSMAMFLFSKQYKIRKITYLGFLPLLFHVNEIMFFGIPILWNPIFLIPFILVPLVSTQISLLVIDLFSYPYYSVPLMTPVLIDGYLSFQSILGILVQILCILMGTAIFAPFVRLNEERYNLSFQEKAKILVEMLNDFEFQKKEPRFLARTDNLGSIAQTLAADLADAIRQKKLFLVYQPQVDSDDNFIGAEALIRWKHPIIGYVYPPLIICLAKESNQLFELENLIFDQTCETIEALEKEQISSFKISVNITSSSLEDDRFLGMLENNIEKYQIHRENLSLEMTEHEAITSSEMITGKLEYLKNKNHKLMIDDFGMGHTSLLYLETNLFDVVKLDASLTRNVLNNPRITDIINSIKHLSNSLDFSIVSEYIETSIQKDYLKQLGSTYFQGYLYSKPLEQPNFITLIKGTQ